MPVLRLSTLTRRPTHLSSPDDMAMQVRHRFAGVGTVIEHEAKTVFIEAELLRDFRGFNQEMPQHLVIIGMRLGDTRDRFLGNDQDVNRRLWFHIFEGDDLVVFVNDLGGNFARNDFLKKRLHFFEFRVSGLKFRVNFA